MNDLKAFGPLSLSMTYGAGGNTRERTMNALNGSMNRADSVVDILNATGMGRRKTLVAAKDLLCW